MRVSRELANQLAVEFPQIIKEVRGWGLICGIELADDCGISAADVTAKLMSAGIDLKVYFQICHHPLHFAIL